MAGACACLAAAAHAQDHGPVEISAAVRHDVLPSLREVKPQADGYKRRHERGEHMLPLPNVPPGQSDGAVQRADAPQGATPVLQTGVLGVGNGFSGPQGAFTVEWAPPDTVGAIGASQYVQIVNSGFAIFDKNKNVVYGPVPANTPWIGFGGACEADNDGDAVVVYDRSANRWIISQFAVASAPYFQCVAVSQTADATGAYNRYAFSYGSAFPDYPKMGVWPDAYYETFNMFNGNSFSGSKLCAYDRTAMLAGLPATQQCFQLSSSFGGVLPSDLDGATLPPPGSPNYLMNFGTNALNLWKFHVDWNTPANTSLNGPTSIPVAAFTPPCPPSAVCVMQPVRQQLDSLGDRLMFRLAYRNFGDHESLVVNHAVTVGTDAKNPYTGVRWYEIRSPGTTPAVYQQSTFAPDTNFRWMGSIAMDAQGNIAMGYSVSGATLVPAIRYTGRLASDALNTMQTETSLIEGAGSQTGKNLDRWGDYSALTLDPVDDCTFWFTSEYLPANGAFNWSTRIGSFKFDSCGGGKHAQTLQFDSTAPVGATFGGSQYTVIASATSGLPVALSIAAASATVCSLNGSTSGSKVSLIGVGACTVNADQGGNDSYNAATQVQQTFDVGPASQTISFTSTVPLAPKLGDAPYLVTATATSGLAVTLAIDAASSSVCAIDGASSGSNVSFIGSGTCTIDATQGGNGSYSAAPLKQQAFAVGPGVATLEFTTQPVDVAAGELLASVAVTIKDPLGNAVEDNGSTVAFSVSFCGGPISIGSALTVHGVATLSTTQRFYSALSPAPVLQISAVAGALSAQSAGFFVLANGDLVSADGFEACQL